MYPTIYVLSKNKKKFKFFLLKFFQKSLFIAWASFRNETLTNGITSKHREAKAWVHVVKFRDNHEGVCHKRFGKTEHSVRSGACQCWHVLKQKLYLLVCLFSS